MTAEDYKVWEKRWHPLLQEWVIIASHRHSRPWNGSVLEGQHIELPKFDSNCYLCPGNMRANNTINPKYENIFVFSNDFPSISLNAPTALHKPYGIYKNAPAKGIAKVLCYTPFHNITMAELDLLQIENIIDTWRKETSLLSKIYGIKNVIIFENKGLDCGASNPHAHCQIFATDFLYKNINTQLEASYNYFVENNNYLFHDIINAELEEGNRIIFENRKAIAFLPYFSRYPFESYITTKKTYPYVTMITDYEVQDLAKAIKSTLVKYDNLWKTPLPYVMMIQQAPIDSSNYNFFHFHIEIYPIFRQKDLKKYLGGAEIGGGNFHSDICPEKSAEILLSLSSDHYKKQCRISN
jgi:UDPglucose--hexose-1-phosphate uridylyltransferase